VSPRSFARTTKTRQQFDAPSRAGAHCPRSAIAAVNPVPSPKPLRDNRQCHSGQSCFLENSSDRSDPFLHLP
jgi:hypothetical protein